MILECDEIWPFVGSKKSKVWTWLAADGDSRKIAGAHAGSIDKEGAAGLWNPLPESCGKNAVFCFWPAYQEVFPRCRNFSGGKESGTASHIERLNLTLRQRMPRLARKTLSFSENMKNHIRAFWNFIHHYNENIALKLASMP